MVPIVAHGQVNGAARTSRLQVSWCCRPASGHIRLSLVSWGGGSGWHSGASILDARGLGQLAAVVLGEGAVVKRHFFAGPSAFVSLLFVGKPRPESLCYAGHFDGFSSDRLLVSFLLAQTLNIR